MRNLWRLFLVNFYWNFCKPKACTTQYKIKQNTLLTFMLLLNYLLLFRLGLLENTYKAYFHFLAYDVCWLITLPFLIDFYSSALFPSFSSGLAYRLLQNNLWFLNCFMRSRRRRVSYFDIWNYSYYWKYLNEVLSTKCPNRSLREFQKNKISSTSQICAQVYNNW